MRKGWGGVGWKGGMGGGKRNKEASGQEMGRRMGVARCQQAGVSLGRKADDPW